MDLNKSREFFDPTKVKRRCHIIGCGAIGSSVAELLTRQGVEDFTLWDFDKVERHNIVNQMFTEEHIGQPKTEALVQILTNINPALKQTIKTNGEYKGEPLNGIIFICTDTIESRQLVAISNKYNPNIEIMFDFRMTLTEGQHYAAIWKDHKMKENFIKTMNFTHEEAKKNTPVSACGFELSVAPTVRNIAALGIINFTNYINNGKLNTLILSSPYQMFLEAY